ncbi:MAG: MATE family efflux transporter [Cellulosilyticum sp.]|nr:MATE family efflux transporter [Cellulosilyticum sp.]
MKQFIGDKKFYKMVLAIAIPIMIQNGITNFVSMLDNLMVGRLGTEQMTGVAIANQLIFVFNLCIFGGLSGAGIFGAQFYGQKDYKGVQHVFRFKIMIGIVVTALVEMILILFGDPLIQKFLHDSSSVGDLSLSLMHSRQYLMIMLIGLIPFTITQIYSSTLRETGETVVPMKAGIMAVIVNLLFNTVLIFGLFGMPALGARGAAVATVIARFVECGMIVNWTHRHVEENPYIKGVYRSLHVPGNLTKQIIIKGTPLMINEAAWAGGMTMLMQCYSVRGLSVVAGLNIASTISNVFNVVFIALGSSVAIIVGQLLGAGEMKKAQDTAGKMIFFSVASCLVIGSILALISPLFPKFYNTSEEVKHYATWFILITAICMPQNAFMHATYFTLRSGGKTIITFLFDSVYVWVISIPLAYALTRYTSISIIPIYFVCQFVDIIKCIIGFILVKKGVWLENITVSEERI